MPLPIVKGTKQGAVRAVIYGTEGIGKSTLASKTPSPIFLDIEDGADQIGVDRLNRLDWRGVEAAISELTRDSQGYRTVVIDTADWCEKALIENMLLRTGKRSIEDYGYGKGYTLLCEEFARFLATLDKLIENGVNVVFIAHALTKRVSPPDQTDGFDRYELKLTKQVAPLLKEWADMILFCKFKLQIVEGTDGKLKAQGGKERVICATHSAAWDAKNRFGLPDEMPMDYGRIAHIFGGASPSVAAASKAPESTGTASPSTRATTAPAPVRASAEQVAAVTARLSEPAVAQLGEAALDAAGAVSIDTLLADEIANLIAKLPPQKAAAQPEAPAAVPANIAAWLDQHAAKVNGYLVGIGWVGAGQTWRQLSDEKITSVVSKTDRFARAAQIPALAA